ncbi:hypothetical protein KC669_02590 [Candidatus Dojkabacteria bacterium]|uniref:UMP kinase n=1 Tax=Candidatus Dojkabacteria bacterium TaxID=2099670 RepID=A0A955LBD7_9BACT|nr:hypothetical protein [Candidatus Dojkabacteria bacterium]
MKEILVLKIGGSILSPSFENLFDFEYVKQLRDSLIKFQDTYQFVLITGGGHLARKYMGMAKENNASEREIDWAGTSSNNHNAVMLRVALGSNSHDRSLTYNDIKEGSTTEFEETFLTVGANEPGHSGDFDTVIMANNYGAKKIFILKDVNGVYPIDPDNNPNAELIKDLTWEDYKKILGTDEFTPKMAVPFDPKATELAQQSGISCIILNGKNLDNLEKAIRGEEFIGTTIHP